MAKRAKGRKMELRDLEAWFTVEGGLEAMLKVLSGGKTKAFVVTHDPMRGTFCISRVEDVLRLGEAREGAADER